MTRVMKEMTKRVGVYRVMESIKKMIGLASMKRKEEEIESKSSRHNLSGKKPFNSVVGHDCASDQPQTPFLCLKGDGAV